MATLLSTAVAASPAAVAAPAAPSADAGQNTAQYSNLAKTPYMGWSSWSLESTNYPGVNPTGSASWLTEQHVLQQTDVLADKLKSHGYNFVNIDAGWLGGYDVNGLPFAKASTFPDGIKYIADYAHKKGLKLGIYLAVGLDPLAYGGGKNVIKGATGCTTRDIVYPDLRLTNGWDTNYKIDYSSPCAQAYANSIANVFAGWNVDFLKMDGVGPGSFKGGANYDNTADIAAWSQALKQTGRSIQFTISWALSHNQADTWKKYSNGWRIDTDVECYCDTIVTWDNSVKQRWYDVVQWIPDAGPGHWNNLDSLDVGNGQMDGLTEAERQSYMTLWAIEAAPLYVGDDLTKLDDYGVKLLTNDEVIAVDQAGTPAKPVSQTSDQQVWSNRNADGSYTVALFNNGAAPANVTANWNDLGISGGAGVRDLWSRSDVGNAFGSYSADLPAHGSKLLRITPWNSFTPTLPVNVHGTASTPSSVSLAWDPSGDRIGKISGYDVYAGGKKVAFTKGTTVTVSGLKPGTGYQFTVVATDGFGLRSPASKVVGVTTPATDGAVSYEAEAATNTLDGGASVVSCAGCSGGNKVGNIGGGGSMTFNGVTVPAAGTYLMTLSYVDADSSRIAVVTVNGTPFNLPVAGSNNNDWSTAQSVTVPVQLKAGANTLKFGNPNGYVYDVDKITL
jgi:chitodextrinase